MKRTVEIDKKYLLIPICAQTDLRTVSFSWQNEKIYAFRIPVNEEEGFYGFHYYAPLNVEKYIGKRILIEGDVPGSFLEAIALTDGIPVNQQSHPLIHFAPRTGWMNDPNGLIKQNGMYHLFFQHNPFDTRWENMCWGHAVSQDLIHWEQLEMVLYPDENGTIYSGSGIVNERGLLDLPKDAQIFFYTSAGGTSEWSKGKTFTQRIAYSTDGGKSLAKMEGCAVKQLAKENRDPKVYWHEESGAYYMVLYLSGNDFAILRSKDLKNWKRTQIFTLEKCWECPDLRRVSVEGGGEKWIFWSADGFYYLGDFDGFTFKAEGTRQEAYKTTLPYAAQTIWGCEDVITIPWLRTKNKEKLYTGVMGIPRKLTLARTEKGLMLRQLPVEGFQKSESLVHSHHGEGKLFYMMQKEGALEIRIHMEKPVDFSINLYGTILIYAAECGKIGIGKETISIGNRSNDFSIIADGEILEISANNGLAFAAVELESDRKKGNVVVDVMGQAEVEIYRVD